MPFWTYMLHCRDRTFYTGHTDDLDLRMAQHEQGTLGVYTARKRPVKLVWSAEFPSRHEAIAAERQIRGWRRQKKLALVRGDWETISGLAKRKERLSTGSGRTGSGSAGRARHGLDSVSLHPHPDFLNPAVSAIEVEIGREGDRLALRYIVTGRIEDIELPARAAPDRADELWLHTCFELFLAKNGSCYREFNLSPSGQWASYDFDGYRRDMRPAPVQAPRIRTRATIKRFALDAYLDGDVEGMRAGLSAIIEAKDGTKSYWALAHPAEGPPDFHHPDCFALTLAAPGAP
jgi:predicted GIY-YIG superfamily endonuclease